MSRSTRDATASRAVMKALGASGRHSREDKGDKPERKDWPKPDQGKGVTRSGQYRGWRAE